MGRTVEIEISIFTTPPTPKEDLFHLVSGHYVVCLCVSVCVCPRAWFWIHAHVWGSLSSVLPWLSFGQVTALHWGKTYFLLGNILSLWQCSNPHSLGKGLMENCRMLFLKYQICHVSLCAATESLLKFGLFTSLLTGFYLLCCVMKWTVWRISPKACFSFWSLFYLGIFAPSVIRWIF